MHELAIVEGILEVVIPEVKKKNVNKINSIKLKVGEMSGIVPSCIDEYFKVAAKDTIADGARIDIEVMPVTMTCHDCGYEGSIERGRYSCPKCDSKSFRITGGHDYFVDSVEVE